MTPQMAAASSNKLRQTAPHLLMGKEMEGFRKHGDFYVVAHKCDWGSDFHILVNTQTSVNLFHMVFKEILRTLRFIIYRYTFQDLRRISEQRGP